MPPAWLLPARNRASRALSKHRQVGAKTSTGVTLISRVDADNN
jgi:hypothetical protein